MAKTVKKCYRCGATPLYWHRTSDKRFVLVDGANKEHACNGGVVLVGPGSKGGPADSDGTAPEGLDTSMLVTGQHDGDTGEGAGDGEGEGETDQNGGQDQPGDGDKQDSGKDESESESDAPPQDGSPEGNVLYKLIKPYTDKDISKALGKAIKNSPEIEHTKQQIKQAQQHNAKILADEMSKQVKQAAERERIIKELTDKFSKDIEQKIQPHTVTHDVRIVRSNDPNSPETLVHGAHKQMARLLRMLAAKQNVMLVGPAGSGKTHAAHGAADALELEFYPMSVGPQTSKSDLLGYMDAHGKLVRTVLREAFEHGGVFLLDEMDAGNPGVLTVINAMLSNAKVAFPDGVIDKHDAFRVIAAANTYGHGASRQYVGRQQLDAATLNRFVGIDWEYDTDLETQLAGDSHKAWRDYVWALRSKADKLGMRAIFGTRQILQGVALLNAGFSRKEVESHTVFFGLSGDDISKLAAKVA